MYKYAIIFYFEGFFLSEKKITDAIECNVQHSCEKKIIVTFLGSGNRAHNRIFLERNHNLLATDSRGKSRNFLDTCSGDQQEIRIYFPIF